MSILETLTVYAGVPAAVFAVIAGLVYLSSVRPARRYRPGRPYEFTPVWFLSTPGRLTGSDEPVAIEAPGTGAAEVAPTAKGGARGSW
ncbi:MAG: aa3-type cytochrome oxidase subunit CtaJ [Micromonosporaceae bacterium]